MKLFVFETVARTARESNRVSSAFYRFLEQHSEECVDQAAMHIEHGPDRERISIHLWSAEAVAAYARQLSTTSPPPLPEFAPLSRALHADVSAHA